MTPYDTYDTNRRDGSCWSIRSIALVLTVLLMLALTYDVLIYTNRPFKMIFGAFRFISLILAIVGLCSDGSGEAHWMLVPACAFSVAEVIVSCAILLWACYSLALDWPAEQFAKFGRLVPNATQSNIDTNKLMLVVVWGMFVGATMAGLHAYALYASMVGSKKSVPQEQTFYAQESPRPCGDYQLL